MYRAIDTEPPETLFAMVDLLLRNEADPHAVDVDGNGLLHCLALKKSSEQREATGRLLLDHGVHLDRTNKKGKTAADFWLVRRKMIGKRMNSMSLFPIGMAIGRFPIGLKRASRC